MPRACDVKILIVDDHRAMRLLVGSSLREIGCNNLRDCADGEEALQALGQRPYDLVISDLNMPRLDGLGLLSAIRSDPALKTLAVIMLTSRAEVPLVRQAVALGVNNYLVKPFTMAALRQKIEAVFGPLT